MKVPAPGAAEVAARTRPLPARLYAYTTERFPLPTYGAATALFFLSAYAVARRMLGTSGILGGPALAGTATLLLAFLQVRIADEFKDREHDRRHHPDRPVPRRLVSLGELRRLAVAGAVLQLAVNAALGWATLVACLVLLGYVGLLSVEFFAGRRLSRRRLTYSLAHLTILPVMAAYAYVLAADDAMSPVLRPGFAWYLLVSYLLGLLLELARNADVGSAAGDSYPDQLGVARFAALGTAVGALASAVLVATGVALGLGGAAHVTAVALAVPAVIGFRAFRVSPSPAASRRLADVWAPICALGAYALLLVACLRTAPA